MYVRRKIRWSLIWQFTWRNVLLFSAWSTTVTALHAWLLQRSIDISIPFLPLSTIGVAVAFYVGFKNSQSYDRLWEARKIWGGIVNSSRTFANQVLSFVSPQNADREIGADELHAIHRKLVYRHLAWMNALRLQLRQTTIFDRENLTYVPDLKLRRDRECDVSVQHLLDPQEYDFVLARANAATHLIRRQGEALRELRERDGLLNDFRHIALMQTLTELYDHQGKCERIKSFPFPRQYAYFSSVFVWIFVVLLPFGLVGEFGRLDAFEWLTIPFSILISWIFTTIEAVGDNSEDPFENYINDVPMSAICRTVEIDLREMLGEQDLPPKLKPVDDILL